MSGIIGFLERMGRDSHLRHADEEELVRALTEAGCDETTSHTVLRGDPAMLQATLHVDRTLCCLIYAPDDDDREDEKEGDEEGDHESEDDSPEGPESVPRQ